MSKDEYHTGTAKLIELTRADGASFDDRVRFYVGAVIEKRTGKQPNELGPYFNDNISYWLSEVLCDAEIGDMFVIVDKKLYLLDNVEHEYGQCSAVRNRSGDIAYSITYYNGGCGFSEAFEGTIKELFKEEKTC